MALSAEELRAWTPYRVVDDGLTPMQRARRRVEAAGQWAPWQMLGRRMAVGCVALEITQRCNLDCTYCYLSTSSEALKDIPVEEVFRRIEMIRAHYGPGTDVQVTGGEPTLRKREELVAIVERLRDRGLRPSLFTNGIKATRDLLAQLCHAGLEDVAFHVDRTQERKGYAAEADLNALRSDYIERARSLPLSVIFNTTVFPGNLHEIPGLVRFFVGHADVVRLASFQVGADAGRGALSERGGVSPEAVMEAIRKGAGAPLDFGAAGVGHAKCNRYAYGLIINERMHDFFNDPQFVQRVLAAGAHLAIDRADKGRLWRTVAAFLLSHPRIFAGAAARFAKLAWDERRDLIAARGRVRKLSFFVHNFMDSRDLERDRCEACSFMVMTPEGPMSMCVHNAKRDDYLLVPAEVRGGQRLMYFNPATGGLEREVPRKVSVALTRRNARGRARREMR